MELIYLEALGFAAGAVNLTSSVPQLIANLRNPALARNQSAARNACQAAGNGLWLAYGVTVGSVAMSTFSALGCLMAATLLAQVLMQTKASGAQRRPVHQIVLAPA